MEKLTFNSWLEYQAACKTVNILEAKRRETRFLSKQDADYLNELKEKTGAYHAYWWRKNHTNK